MSSLTVPTVVLSDIVELVDRTLSDCRGRSLIETSAVVDALLDVRQLVVDAAPGALG